MDNLDFLEPWKPVLGFGRPYLLEEGRYCCDETSPNKPLCIVLNDLLDKGFSRKQVYSLRLILG